MPRTGLFDIPRYDALLLIALGIQAWMVWQKLETWDELKAITLFHAIGFALEVFKTSGAIQSWSYPNQMGAWATVHVGKWSPWSLLVVMTFTIIANLKHIKSRIHVPD